MGRSSIKEIKMSTLNHHMSNPIVHIDHLCSYACRGYDDLESLVMTREKQPRVQIEAVANPGVRGLLPKVNGYPKPLH